MLLNLAHQNYKAGNYKQALEHSKAVYERNPHRTDNLLLLGAIYYQVALWLLKFLLFISFLLAFFFFLNLLLDHECKHLKLILFYFIFFSCMTSICASQRMKKLFELIHSLLSAMEIWQMLGRYLCDVCFFQASC